MSETQSDFNPYAADQMPEGGGLTREIIVTSAKYVLYPMKFKDGSPVIDKQTKQPSFFVGAQIEAIRVGDTEGKVEKYEFSAGKKGKPSADGEVLLGEDGKPARIYKTSNWGKAVEKLRAGGLQAEVLYPRLSALTGARLTMAGENKIGADGKPKTHEYNGKTYNDIEWFPEKYNGGAGSRAEVAAGPSADALTQKAEAAVVAILTEAGGAVERKDVIRALGTNLKGDADAVKITTLFARQDFHTGRPWVFDAATSTLKLAEA